MTTDNPNLPLDPTIPADSAAIIYATSGKTASVAAKSDPVPAQRKNSAEMVREFHETFGHPVASSPNLSTTAVSDSLLKLRLDLIAEEFFELVAATIGEDAAQLMSDRWAEVGVVSEDSPRDVVETADALADMEYVIHGFALAAGIPLPKVVEEVHASNMSKLGEDGNPIYREDGKVLKGPRYFRPNIARSMGLND